MNFTMLLAAEKAATNEPGFFEKLWASVAELLGSAVGATILKILAAILILVVGMKLVKIFVKWLTTKSKLFQKLNPDLRSFAGNGILILLDLLLIVMAIATVGVPTASIIAVISSAGLAIGLALQGSLSNLAGGVMIVAFHPFHVGDFIDNGTHCGVVKEIGLFYTTITTIDNRQVMIPNGGLANSAVVNVTANELRRVDLNFPVALTADGDVVTKTLMDTCKKNELVLDDPATEIPLMSVDTGARVYTVRAWCKTEDYWTVYFGLHEQCLNALAAANVPIPHNQIDLHVKEK